MTSANYNNRIYLLDYEKEEKFPGYYITQSVCKILGYTNNCFMLTEMKKCEDKFPEANGNDTWLHVFDIAEPIVAERIEQEYKTTQDKNTWVEVYNIFLSQTVSLMMAKEYYEAFANYQKMMNVLKQYFHIGEVDINFDKENFTCYNHDETMHNKRKVVLPSEKSVF